MVPGSGTPAGPGTTLSTGRGTELSTRPCQHYHQRLPDSVVCEARCPEFPACLPPPWAGLSTDLARFLRRWRERQAVSEGLDRKPPEESWEP
jgi:hypothetical protein